MNLQKIITPILGVILVAAAWRAYGWGGVAIAVTGVVMWVLLHFTRLTQVLKRTANQPIGYVGSAVMLNAKLKPGVNLLHVLALTRSLGERLSDEGAQPEIYRWTDGSASSVTAEFANGKLVKWTLVRPPAEVAPG
ncbi:MAG TPA: glycerate kinase [Ramlibacter sp.]|nr:glycerate kinase [Ramlibacter sp.]